ncbi:hypothetical protein J2T55_000806 [Methylohalomonas lacus]|uniref:Glycosaminoglycan attachment site n=2 Tax=Methylohalomonas lacus TaxID=398773 RepID=A0AAE3L571_9GAMM|nr:hypothetical protein [Methylohalomonas lacus]
MKPLSQWEFDIYALSLPRGHSFGEQPPVGAWQSFDGLSCGILTQNINDRSFGLIVIRRRTDHVWTVIAERNDFVAREEALSLLQPLLKEGEQPESVPPGVTQRAALYDLQGRQPSEVFATLTSLSHHPAAWTLNQLYLALPKPDQNWASDCQTNNFHTRLWEAQLLAAFREQGLRVTQPHESPDFRIENRLGGVAWVEAVTANPPVAYNHVNTPRSAAPADREEIFFGSAAERFAKTLGNKLGRHYEQLPHVTGHPFMIAIADFQAPASMLWSREALIGYLYGEGWREVEINGRNQVERIAAAQLIGDSSFPAGLFTDGRQAELSAVIFTNACSIGKLNRVAVSGQGAPKGLRYTRMGNFFDRTPGALRGAPFCLDITSEEYRELWPQRYEPWSAELEVFHNPFARYPVSFELLPEATHWFDQGGEKVCRSFYETSILWSQTLITNTEDPPPRLEDFLK